MESLTDKIISLTIYPSQYFEFVERYHQQHSKNLFRFLQMENLVDLFHQNRDKIHRKQDRFLTSIP